MMKLKRLAIFVFSIYGFCIFLLFMLALFPFFIIAFLLPRPANGNLVYKISYIWALLFFFFTGIRYKAIHKEILIRGSSCVFVTNHISYIDIPMMILATSGFPVRILGKAEMSRIPIFGAIYSAGAVTVKRDNAENRKKSIAELKSFLKKEISILICPEGTFNMSGRPVKEFYDGAFRIAIELQRPVAPVIFPDTYDRLNYRSIFSLTPGICRAVFLPAVSTDGLTESDIPFLKEKTHSLMAEEILRLDANWVSKG